MTVSRTTTAMPSRAAPASAGSTITVKTATMAPERIQAAAAEPSLKPARRHTESRAAHHLESRASAKPGRLAAHAGSDTSSRTTTDHDAIRKWAERRGGHPTTVTGTEHGKEAAGVLRLDFGVKDEKLHAVNWDAFFNKFEESRLAFLYQDKTSNGKISRFHKFIHRH
jgi:hypothetical protein